MNREQFKDRIDHFQGHYIEPDRLVIGLYVHLDLGWMGHPFAFSNFKIKDAEQIRKIRALNLKQIRYDPDRSDVLPDFQETVQAEWVSVMTPPELAPEPRPEMLRSSRLKQLNEAMLESEKAFTKHVTTVREAVRNLADHPEPAKLQAEILVKGMVDSVITESDVVLHAISSSKGELSHVVHPLNVTILALMLAKSLDMKETEASELGVAAMFHDVGKEDHSQRKSFLDLHCDVGARIALNAGLSERVATIIKQHHEYMDGSGLPARLRGDEIDPLARVLALVNHFDNLCNPSNPAEALTPYEALSQIYSTRSLKFDVKILNLLVKTLGVYPPGSIVQLSNSKHGIVLTANPSKPLLPLVMVYDADIARETPLVLDLADENGVTIKTCLRPEQLPREVFDYLRPGKRVCYHFLKHQPVQVPHTVDQRGMPNLERAA